MKFIAGVQGSGKSYYAAKLIFDDFSKKSYYKIFTNLDGLNIDYINETYNYDTIFYYDHKKFYQVIKRCYEIVVEQDLGFSVALNYLESEGYYAKDRQTLIIIDEAQNFFSGREDPILLFLITQHRHLFIDLYLLSQSVELVNRSYRILDTLFVAVRPSKQLSKHLLTYKKYAAAYESKDSFIANENLKKNPKIFKIYTSGDFVKTTSIFKKYLIYLAVIFLVFVFLVWYLFSDHFSFVSSVDRSKVSQSSNSNQVVKVVNPVFNSLKKYYVRIIVEEACIYTLDRSKVSCISLEFFNQIKSKWKDIKVEYKGDFQFYFYSALDPQFLSYLNFKDVESDSSSKSNSTHLLLPKIST